KGSSLAILDAALRIAGTGSLGGLRIAVLVEGRGGRDGQWIFDLKEQGTPSAAVLLGEPELDPAGRVVTAYRGCIAHPARSIGATQIKLPASVWNAAKDTKTESKEAPKERDKDKDKDKNKKKDKGKKDKKEKEDRLVLPMYGRRLSPQEDKLN